MVPYHRRHRNFGRMPLVDEHLHCGSHADAEDTNTISYTKCSCWKTGLQVLNLFGCFTLSFGQTSLDIALLLCIHSVSMTVAQGDAKRLKKCSKIEETKKPMMSIGPILQHIFVPLAHPLILVHRGTLGQWLMTRESTTHDDSPLSCFRFLFLLQIFTVQTERTMETMKNCREQLNNLNIVHLDLQVSGKIVN